MPTVKHFKKYLSKRKFLQESFALVGFPKYEIRGHIDLGAGILGRNQGFESPKILRISVQSLNKYEHRELIK